VPQETAVEERPELVRPQEEENVDAVMGKGDEGISRRGLLLAGAGAAGTALGAALIVPAASLGPKVGDKITRTPWRRGRRLVDQQGRPLTAEQIEPRALFTAFPENASRRDIGAAVVLVKLPPEELELPAGREDWAPEGIVAFSKICTHAGCAVSLYRTPLSEPTSHEPALVCPCHYSTFDVRRAAKVIFGPAGRPLPQLPLAIDSERNLVAAGGFSGPVGPAWLSVRRS
jgi:ubiquinol-cytochrome c reductase iron-sulfur subunit